MRSRAVFALAAVCAMAWEPAAHADGRLPDQFDVWHYRAPASWKLDATPDHVTYTNMMKAGYCQLALYASRAATTDAAGETAAEWRDLIEKVFTTSDVKPAAARTTRNKLAYTTTSARLAQDKSTSLGTLHVILTGDRVASVLVLASSAATSPGCAKAASGLLDSLTLDGAPPQTSPPSATGPIGRWATSHADSSVAATGTSTGSQVRQYVFDAKGGYTFHLEAWGGSFRADEWYLVDERGTYTVTGDQLTVAPTSVVATLRGKKEIHKTSKLAVERVTYAWSLHYFQGLGENQLVLHPAAKTARDGEFASNDQFPGSYLYSAKYQPTWQFPP